MVEPKDLPEDVRASFERARSAGVAVHEPMVKTKVQAALEAAGLLAPQPLHERLDGQGVVLFLDLDGVAHRQGACRIDDQGKPVGENLFCWWPQLREVLDEHRDLQVVVHSSWGRLFGPLPYLRKLLPPDLATRVVDITDMDEHRRGQAVQAWVDAHTQDIGAYVVLDDQPDGFASHVPLVLCDPQRGLSDPDTVEQLREALHAAKQKAVQPRLRLGALKGKVAISPDFDDPLPPDMQAGIDGDRDS
jgi:hypothetical protein